MAEEKMTNCPKCGKPILNGGLFTSPAKFNIRCPWCQATLQINIQPKIVTEVVKLGNGETPKSPILTTEPEASHLTHLSFMDKPKTPNPSSAQPLMGKGMKLVGYLFAEEEDQH